jgi:hypothetical protein
VEAEALAGVKKKAENESRTIVFIDESGLSQRPHRCRTCAPRGQTPVLQYHFNWKMLSLNQVPWDFSISVHCTVAGRPEHAQFGSKQLRVQPHSYNF